MEAPFDRAHFNASRFVAGIATGFALTKLVQQQQDCEVYIDTLKHLPQDSLTQELRERAMAEKQHLDSLFLFVATGPVENNLVS